MNSDKLFENAINYPDLDIKERLSRLVGLDDHKTRLTKILGVLINKTNLEAWMQRYHANHTMLINIVLRRPPSGYICRRCRVWKNRTRRDYRGCRRTGAKYRHHSFAS